MYRKSNLLDDSMTCANSMNSNLCSKNNTETTATQFKTSESTLSDRNTLDGDGLKIKLKRKGNGTNYVTGKKLNTVDDKPFHVLCKVIESDENMQSSDNLKTSKQSIINELFNQTEKIAIAKKKINLKQASL